MIENTKPKLFARLGELTSVLNREHFERPPGLTSAEDLPRWKDFRSAYHAAQRMEGWSDFPLQIDFELTSKCNFRCAFCVHGYEDVAKKVLGFDRFQKVIDEGSEFGLVSIKLNYINEPLLVRDLDRYIRYARSRGVLNTFFATNGLLMNERVSRALIDAGLSKVFISLDAVSDETFLAMRQSTKLDKIVSNIERLLDLREQLNVKHPIVRVNFLKTHRNMHEAHDFVEKWTGKVDMIGFQDRVRLPGIDEEEPPEDMDLQRASLDNFRCSFPLKQLVVDSGGSILPCCTFSGREMPMGHVDTHTVKEVWDSVKMNDLRRLQTEGKWKSNSICRSCVMGCVE
jgi:radical SAM protein with 4Fe4S-binding SPASM domain